MGKCLFRSERPTRVDFDRPQSAIRRLRSAGNRRSARRAPSQSLSTMCHSIASRTLVHGFLGDHGITRIHRGGRYHCGRTRHCVLRRRRHETSERRRYSGTISEHMVLLAVKGRRVPHLSTNARFCAMPELRVLGI